MRSIRYSIAMSLDGYIAGSNGETDWITMDPTIDFSGLFKQFDTMLVGRVTFERMIAAGRITMPGMKTVVFSRTRRPVDHPGVSVVHENHFETLANLKASAGKDIWLLGGSTLFGNLAQWGMVDTVEVSVIPVLLGAGVPLAPDLSRWVRLSLASHRVYASGIVSLRYAIVR